jgi:hypothetical protein
MEDADYAVVTFGGVPPVRPMKLCQARPAKGQESRLCVRLMTVWPFADKKPLPRRSRKVKGILVAGAQLWTART